MQQLRSQGGQEARWYCPDRDLAYALPRYFRQAMFVRFGGKDDRTGQDYGPYTFDVEGITAEEFGAECVKVRDLFLRMRACDIQVEELAETLKALRPEVLEELLPTMFFIMVREYREWCAYVSPKEANDKPINMDRLERQVNDTVRGITKQRGPLHTLWALLRAVKSKAEREKEDA